MLPQISSDLVETEVNISFDSMMYAPLEPSNITIGTMTVNVHADNLGAIAAHPLDFVRDFDSRSDAITAAMNAAESVYKFTANVGRNLKNGIIFQSVGTAKGNHKIIKIFRNGNAQFNGVKTTDDLMAMCNVLTAGLESGFRVKGVVLKDPTIQMMTCSFSSGSPLNLEELASVVRSHSGIETVRYNIEIHPGLLYKTGGITVIAFSTGKVLLLGGKSFGQVRDGFNSLMGFVHKNFERVHMDPELVVRAHKRPRRGEAAASSANYSQQEDEMLLADAFC